ncbi:MAG: hypothetical protein HOV81_22565 [Kofleriaceae bacterium]|nr:hypothetical protein [Kofleriaceae bacterium]
MGSTLTVVTSVVTDDFTTNDDRIELGEQILASAEKKRARLVVLPSGFLKVGRESKIETEVSSLIAEAHARGLTVVLGVDTARPGSGKGKTTGKGAPDFDELVETGKLPFFVVVNQGNRAVTWRQRSTTSENASKARDTTARTFELDRRRIHLFACGEIFNDSLKAHAQRGEVAVVPTHTAHGQRFHHAINWANDKGVEIVRATHAGSATVGCDAEEIDPVGAARLYLATL